MKTNIYICIEIVFNNTHLCTFQEKLYQRSLQNCPSIHSEDEKLLSVHISELESTSESEAFTQNMTMVTAAKQRIFLLTSTSSSL